MQWPITLFERANKNEQTMMKAASVVFAVSLLLNLSSAFQWLHRAQPQHHRLASSKPTSRGGRYLATSAVNADDDADDNDSAIQWELLKKHHARGSWKGVWTTYDYMGDVSIETVASVDCVLHSSSNASSPQQQQQQRVDVAHTVVVVPPVNSTDRCRPRVKRKKTASAKVISDIALRILACRINGMSLRILKNSMVAFLLQVLRSMYRQGGFLGCLGVGRCRPPDGTNRHRLQFFLTPVPEVYQAS